MKYLLILILQIFVYSCSSDSITQSEKNVRIKDTTLVVVNIPSQISLSDSDEKIFFFVKGKDTSNCKLLVRLNKKTGSVFIEILPLSFDASFGSLNDSSVLRSVVSKHPTPLSYQQQLKEIRLILDSASKIFDFNKLKAIRFSSEEIDGFAQNISGLYKQHSNTKFVNITNEELSPLLIKSNFANDINSLLLPYNTIIDKGFVDGIILIKQDKLDQSYSLEAPITFLAKSR
ncbi:MAG: hypothetical protein RL708_2044 [Bacteroidota bacterium]|jgi:hypothetical protein